MKAVAIKRGTEVVLKVNGAVAGGVKSIVCKRNSKYIDIEEFLSDKPKHRIARKGYEITVVMDYVEDNLLMNCDSVESIELCFDGRVERYSGCVVEAAEEKISAAGKIENVINISAEEREVL